MRAVPAATNRRSERASAAAAVYNGAMAEEGTPGREIAGFRLGEELGRGGMGVVFLAEQSSPRRRVALKLLSPELSEDPRFRERFARESEAAASTEHPNIVPIYAAGEADGILYIAMRYVEGTDLRDLLDTGGALPARRAAEVISQIGAALDAAHARGLVHRDVKPGNILIDTHGNAYLTDFGLIKRNEVSTGITQTGQFMGSVDYCAPEQIRGDAVDGRADVYSLGCVLFECLAGRPPFERDTPVATLYAHLEESPPSLSSGEESSRRDLQPVIVRAMAKRPDDRFATAGELARATRRAVGATSDERDVLPPRGPRRRFAVAAAIVALAVIASAVGYALTHNGRDGAEPGPTAPSADTSAALVRLDPETGEVLATFGGLPNLDLTSIRTEGLAVGEGGVWVGVPPNLVHVDPNRGTIESTIVLQSFSVLPLVGFRTIWVAAATGVERINPATDEVLRPIRLRTQQGIATGGSIAIGEGAVWVGDDQALYRIDPATSRVTREIPLAGTTALAVGEDAVWAINELTGELTSFDPATGEPRGPSGSPAAWTTWSRAGARSGCWTKRSGPSRSSIPRRCP